MDYRILLEDSIAFAERTGAFHVLNLIEAAGNFCVWGAGGLFLRSYERLFKNRGIKVKYVIDRDESKWGKEIIDNILCISPQQACGLDGLLVLPFFYNGVKEVFDFCEKHQISWIHKSHFILDMQDIERRGIGWFREQRNYILEVYDLLGDMESKRVYASTLYNRIGHGYHSTDYEGLYSEGEYFSPHGLYELNANEDFVDVGAFNGDTIDRFLMHTNKNFNSISAFEMSPKNYSLLEESLSGYEKSVRKKITCHNYGAWDRHEEVLCGDEPDYSIGVRHHSIDNGNTVCYAWIKN